MTGEHLIAPLNQVTVWTCQPAGEGRAYITSEFTDDGQVYRILYAINPSIINMIVFCATIEDMQRRMERLKNRGL